MGRESRDGNPPGPVAGWGEALSLRPCMGQPAPPNTTGSLHPGHGPILQAWHGIATYRLSGCNVRRPERLGTDVLQAHWPPQTGGLAGWGVVALTGALARHVLLASQQKQIQCSKYVHSHPQHGLLSGCMSWHVLVSGVLGGCVTAPHSLATQAPLGWGGTQDMPENWTTGLATQTHTFPFSLALIMHGLHFHGMQTGGKPSPRPPWEPPGTFPCS